MENKVSIITPNFNGAKYIEKAINSVIKQTYMNWELLIIDDCSTDESIKIISKYLLKEPRIKLIRNNENVGPALSRNKGIEKADGRYIAFLDSDDVWYENKLSKQIKFIRENNCGLVYSSYDKINDADQRIGQFNAPSKVSYRDTLKTCSIGCLTALYDTKILGKRFMPTEVGKEREDFVLWLNILKSTKFAFGISEKLAQYRVHDKSISNNKFNIIGKQWKVYRDCENLNVLKSIYYFINYLIRGFIKTQQ